MGNTAGYAGLGALNWVGVAEQCSEAEAEGMIAVEVVAVTVTEMIGNSVHLSTADYYSLAVAPGSDYQQHCK